MPFIVFLLLIYPAFSNIGIGDWNHHTSLLSPTEITIYQNQYIYATTMGGLLEFEIDKSEFQFIKSPTLRYSDLNTLIIDNNADLLLGGNYPKGSIQIFNQNLGLTNNIDHLDEVDRIIKFSLQYPMLFAIYSSNNSFGVLRLQYNEEDILEYLDFFNNFPIVDSNMTDIDIFEDNIYITTSNNIIKGNFINDNLKSSDNWEIISLPTDLPLVFHIFGSNYYVGGYNEFWKYNGTNWQSINLEIDTNFGNDYSVIDIIEVDDNSIGILTEKQYYQIQNNDNVFYEYQYSIPINSNFTSLDNSGDTLVFGLKNHGFLLLNTATLEPVYDIYTPNTLIHNQYDAITVLENGDLVGICNLKNNTKDKIAGLTIISDNINNNFVSSLSMTYGEYPIYDDINNQFSVTEVDYIPGSNNVWSVVESNKGKILFANSGSFPNQFEGKGGVIELNVINNQITIYDTTNNILDGAIGYYNIEDEDTYFLTINQINKDPEGNVWVINPYSEVNNFLAAVQLIDAENWIHISSPNEFSYLPTEVAFDHTGLAWFGFRQADLLSDSQTYYSEGGLKVLDTKGTYDSISDDIWLTIINPEVLPGGQNASIWSLLIDKSNRLWILTYSGIQGYIFQRSGNSIYLNPLYENYNYATFLSFDKGDHIKVDAQNNIWITTKNSGVWLILENIPPWKNLIEFTSSNSSLLSDNVYDIAFNEEEGIVYFATDKGISYTKLPINKISSNFNNLIKITPNPFRLAQNDYVDIYNLFPGSTVKIMNLSGKVIQELKGNILSQNDTAVRWNGRSSSGMLVGSGVYIVAVTHSDGGDAVSKIAVIK